MLRPQRAATPPPKFTCVLSMNAPPTSAAMPPGVSSVILNLVMNGVEAMDSVADRARVLRVISEKETPGVLITVTDSGPGVEPDKIERIFEPFYTTKSHGMGMELPICQSIVKAHGGRLSASLGRPHGLALRLSLPAGGTGG
jgi:signal transduction histidine kinase